MIQKSPPSYLNSIPNKQTLPPPCRRGIRNKTIKPPRSFHNHTNPPFIQFPPISSMNSSNPNNQLQIFIQSPNFNIQTLTLTLTLNQTISHLKSTLFPKSHNSSIFISFNGKTLKDDDNLQTLGLRQCSTLTAHLKSLGGGGDGGATGAESRDCYLNMYATKKPDKVDPNEKRVSKWTTCALSYEPLKPPCVIDRLGNIFNKETLVKALLGKNLPKAFSHIRGLKDMINVHFRPKDSNDLFHCPITGLEFNGKYKFYALSKCGHLLSSKAFKEIKSNSCLVCYTEFDDCFPDKIVINGDDDEVKVLREFVEKEQLNCKSKSLKKNKKKNEESNGGGGGKRFKAVDVAPANANKEVYASIFTSSRKSEFKETYSCRSLPLGRN